VYEKSYLRDLKERGKAKKQAEDDFLKSWDIYYKKFKNKNIKIMQRNSLSQKILILIKYLKNYLIKF